MLSKARTHGGLHNQKHPLSDILYDRPGRCESLLVGRSSSRPSESRGEPVSAFLPLASARRPQHPLRTKRRSLR